MANVNPLEKQLIQCDLSKGINVRERLEVADGSKTFPVVENLVQDSSGALVRRAGVQPYAAAPWAVGDGPKALLGTRGGSTGAACLSGEVYCTQEGSTSWILKGQGPEFSLEAETCCSGGACPTPRATSLCSNAAYHVWVLRELQGAGLVPTSRLVFYSRMSKSVVAEYALGPAAISGTVNLASAVFVSPTTLHVWVSDYSTDRFTVVSIDTSAALPATLPAAFSDAGLNVAYASFDPSSVIGLGGKSYSFVASSGGYKVASYDGSALILSIQFSDSPKAMAFDSTGGRIHWVGATNAGQFNAGLAVLLAEAAHGQSFPAGVQVQLCEEVTSRFLLLAGAALASPSGKNHSYRIKVHKFAITTTTIDPSSGEMDGWYMVSTPFRLTGEGQTKVFVQLAKCENRSGPKPAVLVSMSDVKTGDSRLVGNLCMVTQGATAGTNRFARLAVTLDPMMAMLQDPSIGTTTESVPQPVVRIGMSAHSSLEVVVPTLIKPVQLSRAFVANVLTKNNRANFSATANLGSLAMLLGATGLFFDSGARLRDVGLVDYPAVSLAALSPGTGVTPAAGTYSYVCVAAHVSDSGVKAYSRLSEVRTYTQAAASGISFSTTAISVSNLYPMYTAASARIDILEVYRTTSGGTQFYLCGSTAPPEDRLLTQYVNFLSAASVANAPRVYLLNDNLTDAQLQTQPLLFRQPGTPNSGLDRYPPPSGDVSCTHKDRVFVTDALGERVYYSSFFVDGEGPWFNPVFSFFCHGGTGRITGIASMDGRLVVFKRDAVFVIDGDGPPEGGVAGNEFSPPQLLSTPYGCVTAKSIQVTPEGLIFRSGRGIELLSRGLQAKWLGERVFALVDANVETRGSTFDDDARYRIVVSPSPDIATGVCIELVFDFSNDCWTSASYAGLPGAGAMVDIARGKPGVTGKRTVYRATPSNVYVDTANAIDQSIIFTSAVETGWIKTAVQARQRISRVLLLLQVQSNVRLVVSVAYDFSATFSQFLVFDPSVFSTLGAHEVELQLSKPECKAARFRVQQGQPLDLVAYPIGNARMADILGIAIEIAPKAGAPKLAADHKG